MPLVTTSPCIDQMLQVVFPRGTTDCNGHETNCKSSSSKTNLLFDKSWQTSISKQSQAFNELNSLTWCPIWQGRLQTWVYSKNNRTSETSCIKLRCIVACVVCAEWFVYVGLICEWHFGDLVRSYVKRNLDEEIGQLLSLKWTTPQTWNRHRGKALGVLKFPFALNNMFRRWTLSNVQYALNR